MKAFNLAVIGKDVSKSLSPEMHSFIAEKLGYKIDYKKISVPEDRFEEEVDSLFENLDGFNVTIPYKLTIINHLNKICGDALSFGAVNTVKSKERLGYNTDGLGFSLMLENGGVEVNGKKVLLLGAGGAGRSAAKKLSDAGALVYIYDVNRENSRKVAGEFKGVALDAVKPNDYYLIVNATGIGMHKTEGISPVGEDILKSCSVAVDLIYTPEKSAFLSLAEELGKKIINGSAMLFYQAYFAACIYFGREANASEAKKLFEEYKERTK